jgi:predicted nucleotidyltransferase
VNDPFLRVAAALASTGTRYLVIGVWGANYYASGSLFVTHDQDLFVPLDAANLLSAWQTCESLGLELIANDEPLDRPRDGPLAQAVTMRRALTTATDQDLLRVDLTMVMGSFAFDEVWRRRRDFVLDGIRVPVASLTDIVAAKAAANRPKDRLFLATHADELRKLLGGA